MEPILLVIHLFLALAIIGLVLLQRSEGGGLGIGGGGGGLGGLASPEGTANLLTRATAICAGLFFCTSLALGVLAGQQSKPTSLMDALENAPAAMEVPADSADDQPLNVPTIAPVTVPDVPVEVPNEATSTPAVPDMIEALDDIPAPQGSPEQEAQPTLPAEPMPIVPEAAPAQAPIETPAAN